MTLNVRAHAAISVLSIIVVMTHPRHARGGGGWVPEPGSGFVSLSFTDKVSKSAWDASGRASATAEGIAMRDDLKFVSLSAEIGLVPRVSFFFLLPYLYGREGHADPLDVGTGFSDLWLGAKVSVAEEFLPIAASVAVRAPWLYDRGGAYRRFDSPSAEAAHQLSNEWRGLLKYDVAFRVHASTSFAAGRGWSTLEPAIVVRTGAPSNAVALSAEMGGWMLDAVPIAVKGFSYVSLSLHDERPTLPTDRFPSTPIFDFNDASLWKVGASFLYRPGFGLVIEGGYAQWIWGRSARMYKEPFASIAWTF